jgi:hypothetical protein
MRTIRQLGIALLFLLDRGRVAALRGEDRERGDVPGWVMVTVMTAILVVAILGIFEPQVKSALSGIIDQVSGN